MTVPVPTSTPPELDSVEIGKYRLTALQPGMPVLTLAPLAGVGNWVFRLICARLGARMVGVEFINCRTIAENSHRSRRLLDFTDAPIYAESGMSLLAAQIYGNDIELIARGARCMQEQGAQVIDINFGCSVPYIVKKGCGAAYLRDLDRLYLAVRSTVEAVDIPVIVKTRIGWDEDSINILEVVKRVQDAGAKAISIHARTVLQSYRGKADWSWIGRAVEAASIPVFGNGDVHAYEDALAMRSQTGCDGVMIGRAAMANPWIFSRRNGSTCAERIDLAIEQLSLMSRYRGERVGVLESRKHLALYFRGLGRDSALRRRLLTIPSLPDLTEFLCSWRDSLSEDEEETDLRLSPREAGDLAWGGTG